MTDKNVNNSLLSVIMMGATGAVGGHALQALRTFPGTERITLLGRKTIPSISDGNIYQHEINIFETDSYLNLLPGHKQAICTLGVGEPSKISKEDFVKIDKLAVIEFATACKKAGIEHFTLLGSVGASPKSSSHYLRTKGELVEELKKLRFERLSVFQPSMILTPTNRYGVSQAIVLRVWPILKPVLFGGLRKYRGVPVDLLGKAIALNILTDNQGFETLHWDEFYALINTNTTSEFEK